MRELRRLTPGKTVALAEGLINDYAVDPHNGNLYAVWQDSSFTGVDEIAFSMTTDGGFHWTAPVRINQTPPAPRWRRQAFVPRVHVASDGTVGVTYYDFRNNTHDPEVPHRLLDRALPLRVRPRGELRR